MNTERTIAAHSTNPNSRSATLIQRLHASDLLPADRHHELFIVRGDCLGSQGQGNKLFKLKYTLPTEPGAVVLSPGGPHSNHLHALAIACSERQHEAHGFVRGLDHGSTSTIEFLRSTGMQLHHLDRIDYRQERELSWTGLAGRAGLDSKDCYLLPEGGSSVAAVQGVREWAREILTELKPVQSSPVEIYIAGGTGATAAGFICEAGEFCRVAVLPAGLFGSWLHDAITAAIAGQAVVQACQWRVITSSVTAKPFGRMTDLLERFISDFDREYGVRLDPVYTCRLALLLSQRLQSKEQQTTNEGAGFIRRSVLVHTGGLQQPARPARSPIKTWISSETSA